MPFTTHQECIHITEPHPSITHNLTHAGRGGAGNYFRPPARLTSPTTASGPASLLHPASLPAPPSTGRFAAGRGGAGNIHRNTERPAYTLEDELERQTTREQRERAAGIFHVGRGGAGNMVVDGGARGAGRKGSTVSVESVRSEASVRSSASEGSENRRRSGVLARLWSRG